MSTIIYWRVSGFVPNLNSDLGGGCLLEILHDTGTATSAHCDFTNDDIQANIFTKCEAAVAAHMASEFPLVTVSEIRNIPY